MAESKVQRMAQRGRRFGVEALADVPPFFGGGDEGLEKVLIAFD